MREFHNDYPENSGGLTEELESQIPSIDEYFETRSSVARGGIHGDKDFIAQTATDLYLPLVTQLPYNETNTVHHPLFLEDVRLETSEEDKREFLENLGEYGISAQLDLDDEQEDADGDYMWLGPGVDGLFLLSYALETESPEAGVSKLRAGFENPYFLHENPEYSDSLGVSFGEQSDFELKAFNPHRGLDEWETTTTVDLKKGGEISLGDAVDEIAEQISREDRRADVLYEIILEQDEEPDQDESFVTDTKIGDMRNFRTGTEIDGRSFQYDETFVNLDGFEDIELEYTHPVTRMQKRGLELQRNSVDLMLAMQYLGFRMMTPQLS